MKKLARILAVVLVLTLLAGMTSTAMAAEAKGTFKFSTAQSTLNGAQTVTKSYKLATKAASLKVTVKITSNVTGEEKDVDIYRLKYEVLGPDGKRLGSQVALDALDGKTSSTQTFTNVKAGTIKVKITTGASAKNLIYTVNVSGEYTASLSKTKMSLRKGNSFTLTSNYAGGQTKTWSSSNTGIATVSSSGVVTGKAPGTATISLKVGTQTLNCKVTVYALNVPSGTYYTKKSYQLSVKNATTADKVTWTSSNTAVAKVSTTGKVTGVSAGSAKITATVKSGLDGRTFTFSKTMKFVKNPWPKTMTVIAAKRLALREGPGKDKPIIKFIDNGVKVSVSAINGEWATVTVGGVKGYMMVAYLK
ncbi:MAG: Ig-like domain-containing protein [Clostridia bacterium]|nr:Ig-like domain-containing protein [Clostridia bacterium]